MDKSKKLPSAIRALQTSVTAGSKPVTLSNATVTAGGVTAKSGSGNDKITIVVKGVTGNGTGDVNPEGKEKLKKALEGVVDSSLSGKITDVTGQVEQDGSNKKLTLTVTTGEPERDKVLRKLHNALNN